MADTPENIVQKWRQNVPPNVPKEDVEKVVEFYFPGTHRYTTKSGSHWLVVEDPILRKLAEAGWLTGTQGGVLSFSHVSGKTVKAYLVKKFLDSIDLIEEWRQLPEQKLARQERQTP